jgi:hypothetical protein
MPGPVIDVNVLDVTTVEEWIENEYSVLRVYVY